MKGQSDPEEEQRLSEWGNQSLSSMVIQSLHVMSDSTQVKVLIRHHTNLDASGAVLPKCVGGVGIQKVRDLSHSESPSLEVSGGGPRPD
jgi:hypothetical protein